MARMQISAEQGAFLHFLVRLIDARIAVEIGVFTGYSALVTALALRANAGPGAHLIGLDISTDYTDLAKPHWGRCWRERRNQFADWAAQDSLKDLSSEGYEGRVDFIFIDADKTGYLAYLEAGIGLLRPGGLMVFDNVLWSGRVSDPDVQDPDTNALREVALAAQNDPRVEASMIAVGDGLLLVRKR